MDTSQLRRAAGVPVLAMLVLSYVRCSPNPNYDLVQSTDRLIQAVNSYDTNRLKDVWYSKLTIPQSIWPSVVRTVQELQKNKITWSATVIDSAIRTDVFRYGFKDDWVVLISLRYKSPSIDTLLDSAGVFFKKEHGEWKALQVLPDARRAWRSAKDGY